MAAATLLFWHLVPQLGRFLLRMAIFGNLGVYVHRIQRLMAVRPRTRIPPGRVLHALHPFDPREAPQQLAAVGPFAQGAVVRSTSGVAGQFMENVYVL